MHIAPYFTAFGLLAIYLSSRVVAHRRALKISVGDGHPDLLQANRAFGNFAEYTSLGLVFLFGLEYVQSPVWYVHLAGASLLVGRLLHAYAFTRSKIVFEFRVAGMLLTWLSLLLSSVGVTLFSFMALRP